MRLKCERPKESKESYENDAQQKPQPVEKEAEVVADRGEHGVDGVADAVSEVIVAHAVLGLEMTDYGLDGRTPFHLAFDLWSDAALLPGGIDLELVIGWRIVHAVSGIGDDTLKSVCRLSPASLE